MTSIKEIQQSLKVMKRQLFCPHRKAYLNRWHLVHYPNSEPLSVEAEYICQDCGKVTYLHLYGNEKEQWEKIMGTYKKF